MKIESIINISESPFWISETLPYFFEGYNKDKININFLYLILPFLLTKSIRDGILKSANSSSTFDSLFYSPTLKPKSSNKLFETYSDSLMNKTSLVIVEEKYNRYEDKMNRAILLAYNKGYLKIDNANILVIKKFDYRKTKDSEDFLYDYYKASRNLGIIFGKENISNLYRKCQIKII